MARGQANPPKTCPECKGVFTPLNRSREVCYKQECVDSRSQKYNLAKMEKRQAMKAAGEWEEHVKQVKGTGRGRRGKEHSNTRICLGCDTEFRVQPDTDYHLCDKCHRRNEFLVAEYDESVLGITPGDLTGITALKRDRFHPARKGL